MIALPIKTIKSRTRKAYHYYTYKFIEKQRKDNIAQPCEPKLAATNLRTKQIRRTSIDWFHNINKTSNDGEFKRSQERTKFQDECKRETL